MTIGRAVNDKESPSVAGDRSTLDAMQATPSPAPAERRYALGYEVRNVRYFYRGGHDRYTTDEGRAMRFASPAEAIRALRFSAHVLTDPEWRIYRVDVVRRDRTPEQRRIIATADDCRPGEYVDFVLLSGEGDPSLYLDDDDGWTGDLRTAARLDDAINAVQTHIRFPGSRIQMLAVTPATEGTTEYVVTELE